MNRRERAPPGGQKWECDGNTDTKQLPLQPIVIDTGKFWSGQPFHYEESSLMLFYFKLSEYFPDMVTRHR